MTVHILVEGLSDAVLLQRWARRVLPGQDVEVHPHQGKGNLPTDLLARPDHRHRGVLDQLPATLRGFARTTSAERHAVVILVDADEQDPSVLAKNIERAAKAIAPSLSVTVGVAVEETEAFYLGDLAALKKAFPDANMKLARAYLPDSVCGTCERFGEIVGDGGGNKVAWAEAMGPVLTTTESKSRSPSFKSFLGALRNLLPKATTAKPKKRAYRHPPKARNDTGRRR
jgi:hypothetical protein